jgi:hypothetical protein
MISLKKKLNRIKIKYQEKQNKSLGVLALHLRTVAPKVKKTNKIINLTHH